MLLWNKSIPYAPLDEVLRYDRNAGSTSLFKYTAIKSNYIDFIQAVSLAWNNNEPLQHQDLVTIYPLQSV